MIDQVLPTFDVESVHSTRVGAPPESVYAKAWEMEFRESRLIRALFAVRGLPASALTRSGLNRIRFKVLRAEPGYGFVLGIIGRFWTPTGQLVDFDPERFTAFDTPGYAKAAWSFSVSHGAADTTALETITRVQCLDDASRRWFRLYWLLVGPFSGLIRREILRVIRTGSERSVLG